MAKARAKGIKTLLPAAREKEKEANVEKAVVLTKFFTTLDPPQTDQKDRKEENLEGRAESPKTSRQCHR